MLLAWALRCSVKAGLDCDPSIQHGAWHGGGIWDQVLKSLDLGLGSGGLKGFQWPSGYLPSGLEESLSHHWQPALHIPASLVLRLAGFSVFDWWLQIRDELIRT